MGKFQDVNFDSIGEFLDYLPEDQLKITLALREIIFETIPEIRERLSYNVPFYSLNKGICFIWPSAIRWGKVQPGGVQFGFNRGNEIEDDLNYLEVGNRKLVRSKTFFSLKDIDRDILQAYLFEALLIDQK